MLSRSFFSLFSLSSFAPTGVRGATRHLPSTTSFQSDISIFEEVERRLADYENTLERINVERRELALSYLAELQADFEEVTFLSNRAAKFLPELTVAGESHRAALAFRFQTQCAIARLQIGFGVIPAMRLSALTDKVRSLAQIADEFLSVIAQERGLPVLESDLKR